MTNPRTPALVALLSSILIFSCQQDRSTPEASKPALHSAHEALDRIDQRTPLPLLPMMAAHQKQNMRDHLEAVQALTASLGIGDYAGVKKAAERLGSSQQMTRMCEHMGAHAPGFTEAALGFHKTADTIAVAAQRQDRDAVLDAVTRTLAACTGCHSTYKQKVVDDATWAALAAKR